MSQPSAVDEADIPHLPERRVVVGTLNRTTGALLCATSGPWSVAAWSPIDDVRAKLASGGFEDCDVVFVEAASREELEVAASGRECGRPALVALIPGNRTDLRSVAEKLGYEGCLGSPIDPKEASALARALLVDQDVSADLDRLEQTGENQLVASAIDLRALGDLAKLGGKEFVDDIIAQFIDDAAVLMRALQEAVTAGDTHVFRDQAHALRSCAANVGASGVYTKCLEMREIGKKELLEQGPEHIGRLKGEVASAEEALRAYVAAA